MSDEDSRGMGGERKRRITFEGRVMRVEKGDEGLERWTAVESCAEHRC